LDSLAKIGLQPTGLSGWQTLALVAVFGLIAWLIFFGDKKSYGDNLTRIGTRGPKSLAKDSDSAARHETNQFLENTSQELGKWISSLRQARAEISNENSALLDKYSSVPVSTPKSTTKSPGKPGSKKKSAAKGLSKKKTRAKGKTLAKSAKVKASTTESAAKKKAPKSVKTGKPTPRSRPKTAKNRASKRGYPKP
jgi:hypothetical protein